MNLVHSLFPLLGFIVFYFGIKYRRKSYVVVTLWLSMITLLLYYRASGGEILGSYFNYFHASFYSINLIILISSVLCLFIPAIVQIENRLMRYGIGLLSASLITGSALLIINIWVNATFVENRLAGTPILQVATFSKQPYCDYKYIFYKTGSDNVVRFLCPNYYGLLPSTGELQTAPNFVVKQLPFELQNKFLRKA